MSNAIKTDVVIIGGGIAGLWLLNRLQQQGYSTLLLESNALGSGQTGKAQGIIHSGMKYALQGKLTAAADAMTDMPNLWQQCLEGSGEINLSQVEVLSSKQYLWSANKLQAKLAGFFAGMALKSKLTSLKKADFPAIFQHDTFQGEVHALDEIVVDVPSLIKTLAKPYLNRMMKIESLQCNLDQTEQLQSLTIKQDDKTQDIHAQCYVLMAGAGNAGLLQQLNATSVAMQRRSLHMVMVKHSHPYAVYAHCLGLSSTPRLTLTTHRAADGKTVWYLGGQLAEDGVKRTNEQQIATAREELMTLFPWLDFSDATFASFFVDRAENLQKDGGKPNTCFMQFINNAILAWPTKLAFAPLLSQKVLDAFEKRSLKPQHAMTPPPNDWPTPSFAKPLWDQLL